MRLLALVLILGACASASPLTPGEGPGVRSELRRELGKNKPFTSAVPRSKEPVGDLTVLRIWPDKVETKIAIAALQGIVNRDRPKLYIGIDKPLRWVEYYGGKTVTHIEPDIFKVFEQFKDQVKGLVVYDNSLDALANIAITYAGIEDLIPADPDLARTLSTKYGWQVVHDLRGKWKTRLEAYRWAFGNLFPRCSKLALMHYNHGYRPKEPDPFGMNGDILKTGFMVDYSVEFRVFNWHMPGEASDEDMKLAEDVLQSVPFHTPVFGRSSTQDTYAEPAFVSFVAKFADLHVPAGMSNTSVLSGVQIDPTLLKQKPRPVHDYGRNKVYIAFTNSEKDNLEHVIGGGPPWHRVGMETDDPYRIWWFDPWRGRVPIGWPISPLVSDLAPATLAEFMTTATENDYFLAALSGLCLSSPEDYGAAYPQIQDQLLDEYCKLTGDYMSRLGWTQLQPVGPPGILEHFVKNVPGLTGMMEGYGPHKGMTVEKADYLLDGVPVFHALTEGTTGTSREKPIGEQNPRKSKALAEEILSIKVAERPAFLHIWTVGWDFGPTTLKMAADLLPADYVVVRPDELATLYKKYKGSKAELASGTATIASKGTTTDNPNGSEGLVLDTGKMKLEIGWGDQPQPPVKRIMGIDGKWRGGGNLTAYNPKHLKVESFSHSTSNDPSVGKTYVLNYKFDDGETMEFRFRPIAGKPYVLVDEQSTGADLPSWALDPCADFKPDTLFTDAGSTPLTYEKAKSMGGLPWYRWMLVGNSSGAERDLIGVVVTDWRDWISGETVFWQRVDTAYLEFYHNRTGPRHFAVVALDKTQPDAANRAWKELNGR